MREGWLGRLDTKLEALKRAGCVESVSSDSLRRSVTGIEIKLFPPSARMAPDNEEFLEEMYRLMLKGHIVPVYWVSNPSGVIDEFQSIGDIGSPRTDPVTGESFDVDPFKDIDVRYAVSLEPNF